MKTLTERIYEYLLTADAPVTAGSLQQTAEFADVPVMMLGTALLTLAAEHLASYKAVNGKLCFSADSAYGKHTTPARDNLNQLSSGMGALSKGKEEIRKSLLYMMMAARSKAFPAENGAKYSVLTGTTFDGKRCEGTQYSVAFPAGVEVQTGSDESQDYSGELGGDQYDYTIQMTASASNRDKPWSKEVVYGRMSAALRSMNDKFGGKGEILSWEQDGAEVQALLCYPNTIVLMPIPTGTGMLRINWTFPDDMLPSREDVLQFIKAWTETFTYTGTETYYVPEGLNAAALLIKELTEEHVMTINALLERRLTDLAEKLEMVYNAETAKESTVPLTKQLIDVRSGLKTLSLEMNTCLNEFITLLEHYRRTEPDNPMLERLYKMGISVLSVATDFDVDVAVPESNIGAYNSAADIVFGGNGSSGSVVVREYPALMGRLATIVTLDRIELFGLTGKEEKTLRELHQKVSDLRNRQENPHEGNPDFKIEGTTLAAYFGEECHVVIPDSVRHISSFAFKGCDTLETVVLGKNVRSIGFFAFDECPNLKSITVNEGLERIENLLTGFSKKNKKVKLIVYKDSYAHKYAKEYGYSVELIKENLTPLVTFKEGNRDLFRGLYVPRPDGFMSSVTHKAEFKKAKTTDEDKKNIQYAAVAEDTPNGFEGFYDAPFSIRCAQDVIDMPNAVEMSERIESVFRMPHVHDQYRTVTADKGKIVAKYDLVGEGTCELGNEFIYGVVIFHDDKLHLFQIVIYGDSTHRQQEETIKQWASKFVREKTVRDEEKQKQKEEERKRREEERKREEEARKEAERKRKEALKALRPEAKKKADALRPRYDRAANMIACGYQHVAVLKPDGTVLAVGDNSFGQCNVGHWRNIVAVAADNSGTVGLCKDGTVKHTGYTGHGTGKCTRWKNIKQIVMTEDCVYGLTKDGRVLATAETKTGVASSTASDVTTWRNIRALRARDGVILGITEENKTVAVRRNYYSRCEPTNMDGYSNVEDVALGAEGYGVILFKNGDWKVRERGSGGKELLSDHVGVVKAYQIHGRTMALLTDGSLVYEPMKRNRGYDDLDGFLNRYHGENVAAIASSGSTIALLTKDGRVLTQGFSSFANVSEGHCFGESFRLFGDLDELLAEQDAEVERERIAREEAAERARIAKEEAEAKRIADLYASACELAGKEEGTVKKKLAARKRALKQFEQIPDYEDTAERITALKEEMELLNAEAAVQAGETRAKIKGTVKRVVIGLLVLVLLAGAAVFTYTVILPGQRYNQAVTAMENGDYEAAYHTLLSLEEYGKDLNAYKDCDVKIPEAACGYALDLAADGRFAEAIEMASQYTYFAEGPDTLAQCRHMYGVSLFENGKFVEAIEQLEQCTELDDTRPVLDNCYRAYAEQLFEEQKYVEAFAMHEKVSGYEEGNDDLRDALLVRCDEALAADDYESALEWLTLLAGYKDADAKMQEAKYRYVVANKNREDEKTYTYLKELKEADYQDTAAIFEELYAWKLEITAVNKSPSDSEKNGSGFKRNSPIYVHYKISGGEPGASTRMTVTIQWAGGGTNSDTFTVSDGTSNYLQLVNYGSGTMKVHFYDESGKQIASKSVRVGA